MFLGSGRGAPGVWVGPGQLSEVRNKGQAGRGLLSLLQGTSCPLPVVEKHDFNTRFWLYVCFEGHQQWGNEAAIYDLGTKKCIDFS